MDYQTLGRTGVQVSPLCVGCMNFGWGTEEDAAIQIIHRALDAGINFFDTADVYGRGASETITGKALKDKRDQVFLATKVHGKMGEGPNDQGNSRLHIMRGCEDSLRRLDTDHIDLYQIHRPLSTHDEYALTPCENALRGGHGGPPPPFLCHLTDLNLNKRESKRAGLSLRGSG